MQGAPPEPSRTHGSRRTRYDKYQPPEEARGEHRTYKGANVALVVIVTFGIVAVLGTLASVGLVAFLRTSDTSSNSSRSDRFNDEPRRSRTEDTASPTLASTSTTPQATMRASVTPTPTEDVGDPPRSGAYINGVDENEPHYIIGIRCTSPVLDVCA